MSEMYLEDNLVQFEVVHSPINLSELEIAPGFLIKFPHSQPNWWWRFWNLVFFGFKWHSLSADDQ